MSTAAIQIDNDRDAIFGVEASSRRPSSGISGRAGEEYTSLPSGAEF